MYVLRNHASLLHQSSAYASVKSHLSASTAGYI
uniref:Uncharacterized protein n=1 Tax=Setaria italica TaxID=4555 RepID=K4ANH6_SETIT